MPPLRSVLLALLALLVTAPAPSAAEVLVAGPPLPGRAAGPVQVAGPPEVADGADDPDGGARATRLYVRTKGREVCLGQSAHALPEPDDDGGSSTGPDGVCETLEREDLLDPLHPHLGGDEGGDHVGGAVRAEVATVEVRVAGGPTLRLPTVPAPPALAGTAAADLRFYVADDVEGSVATWRLLDAQGRLVHEEDRATPDPAGTLVRGPVRVASGRDGRWTWSVHAEVRRALEPVPGDPGRRVRSICLSVLRSDGDTAEPEELLCAPETADVPVVGTDAGCEAAGSRYLVAGLAPAGQLPRAMVTGDGAREPLRSVRLPASLGPTALRLVVGAAPPDLAIRRFVGGGRTDVFAPPPALRTCGAFVAAWDDPVVRQPPLGGDVVLHPAGPGGPRLHVRERDAELCLAAERAVRARDCWEPYAGLAMVRTASAGDGRIVAGAVDARVRQVRLELTSGAEVRVDTAPAPAATGRYASALAFFAATAPAGTRVLRIAPVTPGGTEVPSDKVSDPRLLRAPTVRGVVRIGDERARVVTGALEGGQRCLGLATGPLPAAGDRCPETNALTLWPVLLASCDGPAVTVGGQFTGAARTIEAVLAGGRVLRAPVVRTAPGEGVAFLTLPARAALRRLDVRGRRGALVRRYPAPTPAATAQCGYSTILTEARRETVRVVRG